jgi:hypothetical protein
MRETMCRVRGAQRPVLYVIEPKQSRAPSARARSAAQSYYYLLGIVELKDNSQWPR